MLASSKRIARRAAFIIIAAVPIILTGAASASAGPAAPARPAAAVAAARPAAPQAAAAIDAHQQHLAHVAHMRHVAAEHAAVSGQVVTDAAVTGSPRVIAQHLLPAFGWSASQFSCLDPLWSRESGWSVTARNASSGAYGIPQALPGSKMASAGPDWQTGATTQIRWGLGYIKDTYGSPCGAWDHEEATGWY